MDRCSTIVSRLIVTFLLFSINAGSNLQAQDAARDKLVVETLIRLKRFDVSDSEKLRGAVTRHMETVKGTVKYNEYAEAFGISSAIPELVRLGIERSEETIGVNAIRIAVKLGGRDRISGHLAGNDTSKSLAAIFALGQIGNKESLDLLKTCYSSPPANQQVLIALARAIAKNIAGQRFLLDQLMADKLPMSVRFAVGNALHSSADQEIRKTAKELITLPATADSRPLPPITGLIKMDGDPQNGGLVFAKKGTCAKCHKVGELGKDVGPGLSEIGSKLSSEAMFTAILDPNAGVSHNYETFSVITIDGNIYTGLKISDTMASITIRNAEGIDRTILQDDVDEVLKTGVSIMPADLQRLLTIQELVDVVAYLKTLKKK
ncbi:MAG: c-type cytochrome [Pirellulales bacterium]|nr:c-type cytochrome [Pirellulales bacterium]